MNIEQWLNQFNKYWTTHNVNAVIDLFAKDVEYWESPFIKLSSLEQIKNEWQAILDQKDIKLQAIVFNSSKDGKHAVIWQLQYKINQDLHKSAGTYLIQLNSAGKCNYFYQVCAKNLQKNLNNTNIKPCKRKNLCNIIFVIN